MKKMDKAVLTYNWRKGALFVAYSLLNRMELGEEVTQESIDKSFEFLFKHDVPDDSRYVQEIKKQVESVYTDGKIDVACAQEVRRYLQDALNTACTDDNAIIAAEIMRLLEGADVSA